MRDLMLLHGALGAQSQVQAIQQELEPHLKVHSFSFRGHGGEAFPEQGFSIQAFTEDVLDYLNEYEIDQVDIFGYSMGGYVALNLAKQQPTKVGKIATLGTKFDWNPISAAKEVGMLNTDKIEEKVPAFAQHLAQTHAPNDWKEVVRHTAEMMLRLGNSEAFQMTDLADISHEVLIGLGSKDRMVSQVESEEAVASLPNARFHLFEGFPHPIDRVDAAELSRFLLDFFR